MMSSKALIRNALWVCGLCLSVCGCYTPPERAPNAARFHEGTSADVVFLFHRWDNFFIVRPDYREDGFRRPLGVGDLDKAFQDLSVRHNMAVVLVGWNYDQRDMKQIVQGWQSVLSSHGFRRVVCLYGDDGNTLDGAPIIDDWKRPVEQVTQHTTN